METTLIKNEHGFTGLEASIVLIAFVIVAAVFSYVMLGAGFYTTQKSQEVVHSSVAQASSSLALSGDLVVKGEADTNGNGVVDEIIFYITNTAGGTPVDLSKTIITYTDNDDFEVFDYKVSPYGAWIYTPIISNTDNSINLIEKGEIYKVKLAFNGVSNTPLAPGQNVICTTNYTITQDDIDAGSVTNSAFATSSTYNGIVVKSNTDTETVTYNGNSVNVTKTVTYTDGPALTIVKSASPTTYNAVGQIITYSYDVINTGNVKITQPIKITDDKTGIVYVGSPNGTLTVSSTAEMSVDSIVTTNVSFLTSLPGANEEFKIEIKPPEGPVFSATRKMPPSIAANTFYPVY